MGERDHPSQEQKEPSNQPDAGDMKSLHALHARPWHEEISSCGYVCCAAVLLVSFTALDQNKTAPIKKCDAAPTNEGLFYLLI
jgi:hypothetical protein